MTWKRLGSRLVAVVSAMVAGGVWHSHAAGGASGGAAAASPEEVERRDVFTPVREAQQMPDYRRGGTFTDSFHGYAMRSLTPVISSDAYQRWVEVHVVEGLVALDPRTFEFIPWLAESWEVSEDGLAMTFRLREGITFSDGEPLTADDVVFTFELIRNPQVNAARARAFLTHLAEVERIDGRTVRFGFDEPYFGNLNVIGRMGILPRHVYSAVPPDELNASVDMLVGSGPYKLEGGPGTWWPGRNVVLVRDENYWGEAPAFDRLVFLPGGEGPPSDAELLRRGELDVVRPTGEEYRRWTADEGLMQRLQDVSHASAYRGYTYIGWNQRRPVGRGVQEAGRPTPFADRRVRQAMTLLLDREAMVETVHDGLGTVATGPFDPEGPQSDPDIDAWPHDPERARALLREAGFEDRSGDGIFQDEEGRPFEFELLYPANLAAYDALIEQVERDLLAGGVRMIPEPVAWHLLVGRLIGGDFDAIALGWSGMPEADPYQLFHSSQRQAGDNRVWYASAEADEAIEQARVTMDHAERMRAWQRVHRILHEDQPYTFLHNRPMLMLMDRRIGGVEVIEARINFEPMSGGVIPWYAVED